MIHYRKDLRSVSEAGVTLDQSVSDFARHLEMDYLPAAVLSGIKDFGLDQSYVVNQDEICLQALYQNKPVGIQVFNFKGKANIRGGWFPFPCQIDFGRGHAYGHSLFVQSEFRKAGTARRLLNESFKLLKEHQFEYFDVLIYPDNIAINKIMYGLGFQRVKDVAFVKVFWFQGVLNLNNRMAAVFYNFGKAAWSGLLTMRRKCLRLGNP